MVCLWNKWRIFKKPIDINLTHIPPLIECYFHLHNFCIDEREKDWFVSETPNKLIRMHQASYEEYADKLDADTIQLWAGVHFNIKAKVRDATKKQQQFSGRDRPAYNKRRNLM